MHVYAFRLKNGDDLKEGIIDIIKRNKVQAWCILTRVGSLGRATVRLSDSKTEKTLDERLEIVSLEGRVGNGGIHAQISVSDRHGRRIGGRLKRGVHGQYDCRDSDDEY